MLRQAAIALALIGTAAHGTAAQIRYAPTNARYRLTSAMHEIQQAKGRKAERDVNNEQRIAFSLVGQSPDTLSFTITLDSSALTANPATPLPDVSELQGTRVTGTMSPRGAVYSYKSTTEDSSVDISALVEQLTHFLLAVPADAKVGSSWTDSANSTFRRAGTALDSKRVSHFTVLSDTTFAGQRAWRIERRSDLSLDGALTADSASIKVTGSGTQRSTFYVSQAGVFLGSVAEQEMHLVRSMGAQSVTVTQKTTSRAEMIQ